jgi:plasmid stability protein
MATLQVKGFDEALYKALGARAKRENRSISQEVVNLVQDYLARPGGCAEEATRAFLALWGSWEDKRSPRQIAQDIRKSRRTGGRFRGVGNVLA